MTCQTKSTARLRLRPPASPDARKSVKRNDDPVSFVIEMAAGTLVIVVPSSCGHLHDFLTSAGTA